MAALHLWHLGELMIAIAGAGIWRKLKEEMTWSLKVANLQYLVAELVTCLEQFQADPAGQKQTQTECWPSSKMEFH